MSIIPTGRVWELTRSLFPHVSPVLLWLLFITLVPEDLKIKASKSQMLIPKVSLWNTYLRLPMLNFATGGPFVEIVVIISIQPPWCQNSAKFHSSSFSTLSKIPSFRQKKRTSKGPNYPMEFSANSPWVPKRFYKRHPMWVVSWNKFEHGEPTPCLSGRFFAGFTCLHQWNFFIQEWPPMDLKIIFPRL